MTEIKACEVEPFDTIVIDGQREVVDGISQTRDGGAFGDEDQRLFIFDFVGGGGTELNGSAYVEVER